MKVTVAGSAGFCRGVQNAFDKAVSLAEKSSLQSNSSV